MQDVDRKENRGGKREGAGRKPEKRASLSVAQVSRMLRKAKKMALKTGKDVDDILIEFIYHADGKISDRLAAIKLFKEYTAPKPSEGGKADKKLGPSLFLPEQRPPELEIINGSKAA